MLSDRYEEVMSKFNFPRPMEERAAGPTDTSSAERTEYAHDLTLPSAGMSQPHFDIDFNFMDGMFGWDSLAPTPKAVSGIVGESIKYGVTLVDDPMKLSRIKDGILNSSTTQYLRGRERNDVKIKLDRILTASQMSACLVWYFRGWHLNGRFIHEPTFSAGNVDDCLLAALVFLGAAYSPDSEIRGLTCDVIDHVESYVFAEGLLASNDSHGSFADTRRSFQIVQAELLMVITQFWSGNIVARRRAATNRFSCVVQAARAIGLLSVTRHPEDLATESNWILKESEIRTVAYTILLDCALLFFKGLPLRILNVEIECDLPCEELIFDSEHPFTNPRSLLGRSVDARTAFSNLFSSQIEAPVTRSDLTILDTFILIHMLYRFVNDTLAIRLCRNDRSEARCAEDTILADALRALDRWHHLWADLRDEAKQRGQWDDLGFFKNGDQYEAATRLLLSDEARPTIRQLLAADTDRLVLLQRLNSRTAN